MSPAFAARLVFLNGLGFLVFAFLWMTAAYAPIDGPAVFLIDLLQWPLGDLDTALSQHARWLSAIGAGLLAAFGVLTMTIVADGVRHGERSARTAASLAILAWFLIDSAGSIASGVGSNAAFNLPFLALYLAPLLFVSPSAERGRTSLDAPPGRAP
jgi:hypothetical protein